MSESPDVEAIAECYRTFIETFNHADAAAVAGVLGYPYLIGGEGQSPQITPDEPTGKRGFESAFEFMKSVGWARTQIDRLEAVAICGDTGVVYAEFSRFREDGSLLDSGSGNYILRKFGGEWKIVASIFDDNGLFARRTLGSP